MKILIIFRFYLTDYTTSLGCWKDTNRDRAVPTLEGEDSRLTGNYHQRANPLDLCYEVAKSKGFNIFAVQDGAWCAGAAGGEGYKKYGTATNCVDGKGGVLANDVYRINRGMIY